MRMRLSFFVVAVLLSSGAVASEMPHHQGHGHDAMGSIKSLSPSDIADIQKGSGWGLAKAAELNGVPGPIHLLELKTEIPLSAAQIAKVEALYEEMRNQAVPTGQRLLHQEKMLNDAFRSRDIDAARLKAAIDAIGATRAQLRYVHLSTHLKTLELLSEDQVARYNALRGYN